ncbi:TolC family protein [Ottowia thiooxydans]|uniref:Cobalt-zinc-cadmium efflux system outer membrane protein n=1 Tax=Ottowia thiooxydans TaxID=219182 RepID=A0ABV2QHA3_9BURK
MHSRSRISIGFQQATLAIFIACAAVGAYAQTAESSASLKATFDAAWARQPEFQALAGRRDVVQANRRAASAWTPEAPALELTHKTDRLTRNDGSREFEVGIAVPLWLPGERRSSGALVDAESAAVESRAEAARLRLAATVREAWWNCQRARNSVDMAHAQLENARLIARDVARRTRAGDLARADQHQADGAVAAAEAGAAQAEAERITALQQLKALTGSTSAVEPAPPDFRAEAEPSGSELAVHPALVELQDRAKVAERTAALAATRSRANPELTLATTRDRGGAGERYGHTVSVGIRIPLGAGPRYDSRIAAARADALEAQVQLELDQARLQSDRETAVARVGAARSQVVAAERRAILARETRGFFDKSFRLGESDLPTRLRIENEANEAERQSARARIELAAAISLWRQALGLLPQ